MYYLAYGMNTNLEQMSKRCPLAKTLGRVVLENHKLAFKQFCDVVEEYDTSMECALWDITENCESALDVLEGYPMFYDKKQVLVDFNGEVITAMIYFMQPNNQLAGPSTSYLNMVLEGYKSHNMDADQVYKALEETEHAYHSW
jgi:gamma-glutamylcyclotransferase (GGCT)/AIG2-like uncharacterized protein YtfP